MDTRIETRGPAWIGIALIAIMFTAFQAAFFTLGSAINWPDSLDYEPARIFPMLVEKGSTVFAGYYLYLLYSLLLIPVIFISGDLLTRQGSYAGRLFMKVAMGFAVASAVFRALGIVRWQFAMMHLADLHQDPAAAEAIRAQTEVLYYTLNLYAGKVGEHLGVGLAGALTLLFYGGGLIASDLDRRISGTITLAIGLMILPLEDFFSWIPEFYITVSTTMFLIWLLFVAGWLFRLQSRG